jgi:hypothetical protein
LLNAAGRWMALANQAERDLAQHKPEDDRQQAENSRTAA